MNNSIIAQGSVLVSPRNKYKILDVLGQGGFGITYKAEAEIVVGNIKVKALFAIKEFFPSDYCDRDTLTNHVIYSNPVKDIVEKSKKDFISEAKRLNGLKHNNIVGVNEVFECNGTAYYVMEYIEGESLGLYIEKYGAIDESVAISIMKPIFDAVAYIHKNKITHLDIKPDNIMLKNGQNGEKHPLLIDFGLSKHYDNKGNPTSTINIRGCSKGYSPPEQYMGINTFTPQADVFALAATLYHLLVGKAPVAAFEIQRDIIENSLPKTLSNNVRNAIVRAMRVIKHERTQSVSEFVSQLYDRVGSQSYSDINEEEELPISLEWQQVVEDDNDTLIIGDKKNHKNRKDKGIKNNKGQLNTEQSEIINLIEEMSDNKQYKEAYNLCIDLLKRGEHIEYAKQKREELMPILKHKATIRNVVTVILAIMFFALSIFISIISAI